MPTYSYKCIACGQLHDVVMSISAYSASPPCVHHCGQPMQRHFAHAPALAMVGESHYEGLRATDGTDISSRAKHRAYMRERGLTTVDDFTQTWAKQAREREASAAGRDATRAADIARAIDKLGG